MLSCIVVNFQYVHLIYWQLYMFKCVTYWDTADEIKRTRPWPRHWRTDTSRLQRIKQMFPLNSTKTNLQFFDPMKCNMLTCYDFFFLLRDPVIYWQSAYWDKLSALLELWMGLSGYGKIMTEWISIQNLHSHVWPVWQQAAALQADCCFTDHTHTEFWVIKSWWAIAH